MNIPSLYIKIKSNQHVQWFKGRLIIFVPPKKKGGKTEAKIHVQANKNFRSLLSLG